MSDERCEASTHDCKGYSVQCELPKGHDGNHENGGYYSWTTDPPTLADAAHEPLTKERFMEIHGIPESDKLRGRIHEALAKSEGLAGIFKDYTAQADAVMAVVNEYRPDLTEDLRETARLLLSTTQRAEKAEAALERVRSVLAACDLSDRESGLYMDISAALKGEGDG